MEWFGGSVQEVKDVDPASLRTYNRSICLCIPSNAPVCRFGQKYCVMSEHSESGRAQSPLQPSKVCFRGGGVPNVIRM
jgi:hypothetical protein